MRQYLLGIVLECTNPRYYDHENDLPLGDPLDRDFAFLTWRTGDGATLPQPSTPIGVLIGDETDCEVACTGARLFSQDVLAYLDEVIETVKSGVRYQHSESFARNREPHTLEELTFVLGEQDRDLSGGDVDPRAVSSENVLQIVGREYPEFAVDGPCWLEVRRDGDCAIPWPGKGYGIADRHPDPIEARKAAEELVNLGLAAKAEICLLTNGKQDRQPMFPSPTEADTAAA